MIGNPYKPWSERNPGPASLPAAAALSHEGSRDTRLRELVRWAEQAEIALRILMPPAWCKPPIDGLALAIKRAKDVL